MKKFSLVTGLSLTLALICSAAVGGGKLPDWCGTIASALDGAELVAVNNYQVQFPLGGNLGYPGAMKGLSADHDTQSHRVFNVHPLCGDPQTMVQRAVESGIIKAAQIVLGTVAGILIMIGLLGKPIGRRLNPSLNPAT